MFRGISSINLDAKGRIAIPTRYRAELEDCCSRQLIATVAVDEKGAGQQGCLWLYPLPEWELLEQKINKLPTLNKMAQKLKRFLIGYASECELDAQGRLLLPEKLRQYAGFEKQVILLGQLNKFEIWNDAVWMAKEQEWLAGGDEDGSEALESLSF